MKIFSPPLPFSLTTFQAQTLNSAPISNDSTHQEADKFQSQTQTSMKNIQEPRFAGGWWKPSSNTKPKRQSASNFASTLVENSNRASRALEQEVSVPIPGVIGALFKARSLKKSVKESRKRYEQGQEIIQQETQAHLEARLKLERDTERQRVRDENAAAEEANRVRRSQLPPVEFNRSRERIYLDTMQQLGDMTLDNSQYQNLHSIDTAAEKAKSRVKRRTGRTREDVHAFSNNVRENINTSNRRDLLPEFMIGTYQGYAHAVDPRKHVRVKEVDNDGASIDSTSTSSTRSFVEKHTQNFKAAISGDSRKRLKSSKGGSIAPSRKSRSQAQLPEIPLPQQRLAQYLQSEDSRIIQDLGLDRPSRIDERELVGARSRRSVSNNGDRLFRERVVDAGGERIVVQEDIEPVRRRRQSLDGRRNSFHGERPIVLAPSLTASSVGGGRRRQSLDLSQSEILSPRRGDSVKSYGTGTVRSSFQIPRPQPQPSLVRTNPAHPNLIFDDGLRRTFQTRDPVVSVRESSDGRQVVAILRSRRGEHYEERFARVPLPRTNPNLERQFNF